MSRSVFFVVLWFAVSDLNASVFEDLFPQEIRLGLSTEQLKTVRPAATRSPAALLPRSDANPGSFEMVERISPANFYTYVFRDNILQAVIRSEPVVPDLPPTMNPAELTNLLSRDFQFVRSDKIARASGTLEHSPVTAELWSEPQGALQAFLVSTSQETTIIFFNPSILNGSNFFVGADKIPELKAGADVIRSQTKTDSKSGQTVVDRPWEGKSASSLLKTPSMSLAEPSQSIANEEIKESVQPSKNSTRLALSAQAPPTPIGLIIIAVLLAGGGGVLFFVWKHK